jgi:hypothetical protein
MCFKVRAGSWNRARSYTDEEHVAERRFAEPELRSGRDGKLNFSIH